MDTLDYVSVPVVGHVKQLAPLHAAIGMQGASLPGGSENPYLAVGISAVVSGC